MPEATRRDRVFLVVVDDSPERHVALRYACLRVRASGGRVALLRVVEPAEMTEWAGVGALLEEERREDAEKLLSGLAAEVQERSGVTTTQRSQHWIGHVLARVSAECAERNEPFLSSLCINTGGSVGEGYAVAVQTHTGETPADPDAHAARQRLACHQYFEAADLPADGATSQPVRRWWSSSTRATRCWTCWKRTRASPSWCWPPPPPAAGRGR